jgi:chromate reductase
MPVKKNIIVIIGSASSNSANEILVEIISSLTKEDFNLKIFNSLKGLPHFDPEQSIENPPASIIEFRNYIAESDGVIICTPEYVFSIPSGLKNAIEWCISTTVFSDKPTGLITASASGQKCHEELKLIMETLSARFTTETTLLIPGIKGKINSKRELTDQKTYDDLTHFVSAFKTLISKPG